MSEGDDVVKENIRLHKKEAESYEKDKTEIYNEREQERIRSVLCKIEEYLGTGDSELKALDLGCGTGNILKKLDPHFDEVIGIDLSDDMLSVASSNIEGDNPKLVRGRIANLPFPDGCFDMVSAYSLLHHLPSFSKPISEISRVLKEGGIIYIDHEPIERENPLVKAYLKFCDVLDGRDSKGLPPYTDTEGRRYCDYQIHHGENQGVPISRILNLCRNEEIETVLNKKYLIYGTEEKNPLYSILKPFIDSEWLLIGRKKAE